MSPRDLRCRALLLALLAGCGTPERTGPRGPLVPGYGLRLADGAVRVNYDDEPVALLRGVRLVLGAARESTILPFTAYEPTDAQAIRVTCAPHPDHEISVHLHLDPSRGAVEVALDDRIGLRSEVCELTLDWEVPGLAGASESWLPHLHRSPSEVCGDGAFQAPIAFVRKGPFAFALLPSLRRLARERRLPQALELESIGDAIRVRHGFVCHEARNRSFYRAGPENLHAETTGFAHSLRFFRDADRATLDELFRELWRPPEPADEMTTLDEASAGFFRDLTASTWIDLSTRAGKAGTLRTGLADRTDGLAGDDAWFGVRQQTLRTAYGMALFGVRTGDEAFLSRAEQALAHALTAPQRAGLLPSLFLVDAKTNERRWILDSESAGDATHFHTVDAATTLYWMLRLSERFEKHRPAVLAACRRAARFLRQNQRKSGGFPDAFEQENLAPRRATMDDDSASTACVARFLAEYASAAGDQEALDASRRALEHLDQLSTVGIWRDFEHPGDVDPRSGVPAHGTLGLIHGALAAFRVHELSPDARVLDLGSRLLTRLSRFQQVWTPPWIRNARVGGFATGNQDHRWNDARQGLAALAYVAGYRATGDPQWLERGTAALVAGLASGEREFQPPSDELGRRASANWGLGTACTVAEILRRLLGQAVIDVGRDRGLGIDALFYESCRLNGATLELSLFTHATEMREARVRFRGLPEELAQVTLVVNGTKVGDLAIPELRAGVQLEPAFLPTVRYAPAPEIDGTAPWSPVVQGSGLPEQAELEIRMGDTFAQPKLSRTPDGTRLVLAEPFGEHATAARGSLIRSRVLWQAHGRSFATPSVGYATSRVAAFLTIDPGEGGEAPFLLPGENRLRRFVDGREGGRHATGAGKIEYELEIPARSNRVELRVRLAGSTRIRAGSLLLHEDKVDPTPGHARELRFELSDHRVWSDDRIRLAFEPTAGTEGVDVAWLRYSSTGRVASTAGLGEPVAHRSPDARLRVLVVPLKLVDAAPGADREALHVTFFGGPEHKLTPPPESRATAGSLAALVDELSGGRTGLVGEVLDEVRWDVLSAECGTAALPESLARAVEAKPGPRVDAVFAIVDPRVQIPPRQLLLRDGRVPLVFLPARRKDGSFLATGEAAAALFAVRYRTRRVSTPDTGNFGRLALSSTDHPHVPAGPLGINLARTGWADFLFVERRDHRAMVLSPLARGRSCYVLDGSDLPGGGRLYLEVRSGGRGEPGLGETGLLMYEATGAERPFLRDLEGRTCRPSLLRHSASRDLLSAPFHQGRPMDLFDVAASRLPADRLTGERLWEIREFQPLKYGKVRLDIRYRATDLLADSSSRWRADPATGTVHRVSRGVVAEIAQGGRLRLTAKGSVEPTRVYCHVGGIGGACEVVLGAGDQALCMTTVHATSDSRWAQADLPPSDDTFLELRNSGSGTARVEVSRLIRVPRVPALHQVQPTRLRVARGTRLMDGRVYGRSFVLDAQGKQTGRARVAVVLPRGPLALRIRGGLHHDATASQSARLSITLIGKDGSARRELLVDREIRRTRLTAPLFLGVLEVPAATEDRVEFLELTWTGSGAFHVVDLALIRP